jgi:hypothetical protein
MPERGHHPWRDFGAKEGRLAGFQRSPTDRQIYLKMPVDVGNSLTEAHGQVRVSRLIFCSGRRGPRFKSGQPDSESPDQASTQHCLARIKQVQCGSKRSSVGRAAEERGTQNNIGCSPIGSSGSGCVDGQRHPRIRVARSHLRHLHIDTSDGEGVAEGRESRRRRIQQP